MLFSINLVKINKVLHFKSRTASSSFLWTQLREYIILYTLVVDPCMMYGMDMHVLNIYIT